MSAEFRRPSARVRVHSVPFDPTPAQRPAKARRLAEHERQARERKAAIENFGLASGKLVGALTEAGEVVGRFASECRTLHSATPSGDLV